MKDELLDKCIEEKFSMSKSLIKICGKRHNGKSHHGSKTKKHSDQHYDEQSKLIENKAVIIALLGNIQEYEVQLEKLLKVDTSQFTDYQLTVHNNEIKALQQTISINEDRLNESKTKGLKMQGKITPEEKKAIVALKVDISSLKADLEIKRSINVAKMNVEELESHNMEISRIKELIWTNKKLIKHIVIEGVNTPFTPANKNSKYKKGEKRPRKLIHEEGLDKNQKRKYFEDYGIRIKKA